MYARLPSASVAVAATVTGAPVVARGGGGVVTVTEGGVLTRKESVITVAFWTSKSYAVNVMFTPALPAV